MSESWWQRWKAREPYRPLSIPLLPAGATREQIMEHAAMCGLMVFASRRMYGEEEARPAVIAYLERWHPDDEVLAWAKWEK